jgi:vitamin B12 transporter
MLAVEARAQTAQELPGIVVQGATLEAPPRRAQSARPSGGASGPSAPSEAATVSGGADEGLAATGGLPLDRIGSSVSVVTASDIRAQEARTAAEVLRSLPGLSVSRTGTFAGLTQVRIRGAEASHTLVLIDGVEANDPTTGDFDFSDLSTEDVERIEIIRGPQSGLYGSNAVGGVINVITKGGRGPLTISGKVEGGSFDTRDVSARISGGNDKIYGSVSYHRREATGFNISQRGIEDDDARLSTFSLKTGVALFEGATADIVLRKVHKDGGRDGFGGVPGQLATAIDDASTFTSDIFLGGVNVRWDMFGGALTHVVRASRNTTRTTDLDMAFPAFPFRSENLSEVTKYGYVGTVRFGTPLGMPVQHALSGLIEQENESFTPGGDLGDNIRRDRSRVAAAAEWRGDFADRLFVTAGVRRDDNDRFDDFTTWRTTASLSLREWGVRPHASAGTGVKLPTQFEQFGSFPAFFIPNPNLKAEESTGWDAGIEFSFAKGWMLVDVTYFNAELTNKITTVGFPQKPINLPGVSHREGIEVAGRVNLSRNLVLGASYTHLDATDPTGLREVRRPPHAGRVDLTYGFADGKGKLNLAAIYNGVMDDLVFRVDPFGSASIQERLALDDYWLVAAAASYRVQPGVDVFARVENVFDEKYQEIYGFNTPGLSAYAGVRFTFEDKSSLGAMALK